MGPHSAPAKKQGSRQLQTAQQFSADEVAVQATSFKLVNDYSGLFCVFQRGQNFNKTFRSFGKP